MGVASDEVDMLRSGALFDHPIDAAGLKPAGVVDQSNVARLRGEVLHDPPGPVLAATVGDHDPDAAHGLTRSQHRAQARGDAGLLVQHRDGNDHPFGRDGLDSRIP